MANFTFSADILNYALFNGGEIQDGTSDYATAVVEYLNRAYRDLQEGGGSFAPKINEAWWWLRKDPPGILTLNPAIVNVGSVTATNGSTTLTFTVDPGAGTSLAGRMFRVDGVPDVFRIVTHTAGTTSMTLDGPFTGLTGAGKNYRIFQTEYTLAADVGEPLSPMRVQAGGMMEIDGTDMYAMDRDWPLSNVTSGVPTQFCMVSLTKVRFNKYGFDDAATSLIRVEYDYLYTPPDLTNSGSEQPVVPLGYRHVLADMVLYQLLFAKNDDRANTVAQQVQGGVQAMAAENRVKAIQMSRSHGRLLSRNDLRTRVRAPLRTQSGIIIG